MISSRYDPSPVEQKWYAHWQKMGLFEAQAQPKAKAYTLLMPPPNITGQLHMGHVLNNTLQDVLLRRKRMQGYVSCWVPGIDHASIATEAKVVASLKKEGLSKEQLGREGFLKAAWKWKETYGDIILKQLFRLGVSCDWNQSCFTMDEIRSDSVLEVFARLHEKGYIYRGQRIVNWDPEARTALSDEEIYYKEVEGSLYHIAYALEDSDECVTVATTRPETLLGDVALCVHPDDDRFSSLIGRRARLPLLGRSLPIISDTYVEMGFGTGCLKITPAHDENDYLIAEKHHLPAINILDERGCLSAEAQILVGEDRFKARSQILSLLQEKGHLKEVKPLRHKLSFSERTQAVVEPRLSSQWFCRMKALAQPALEAVEKGEIRFYPDHQRNTYRHWMENIKDWCISRQLWWGHRMPVWYTDAEQKQYVIAKTEEEARSACKSQGLSYEASGLRQEESVLDTWFSSWIWPLSVFDGIREPKSKKMSCFYPTDDLVTGPDILFFWVARMIMAGYEFAGERPFKNVYFTGIVRDKEGRKMSKSLGNSPDPIDLIDTYGADSIRIAMMMCSKAGGDILFDEALCKQGRDFSNKLWNAFRLIKGWQQGASDGPASGLERQASAYFHAQLQYFIEQEEANYQQFRVSDVAIHLYKFVREDFCNVYLELLKPAAQGLISGQALAQAMGFFDQLLALLHPFMPFISEEIHQHLHKPQDVPLLMSTSYPKSESYDFGLVQESNYLSSLLSRLRKVLNSYPQAERQSLSLEADVVDEQFEKKYGAAIAHILGVPRVRLCKKESFSDQLRSFLVETDTFSVCSTEVTCSDRDDRKDARLSEELLRDTRQEIERLIQFHTRIRRKLETEKFTRYAKEEVIDRERKKSTDVIKKIELHASKLSHILQEEVLSEALSAELASCVHQAEAYLRELAKPSRSS